MSNFPTKTELKEALDASLPDESIVGAMEWVVGDGIGDDGQILTREVKHVVLEMPDGRRYRHFQHFEREWWDTKLVRLAVRVHTAIENGMGINPEYWDPIDPAYGSKAYQELDDMGYWAERERMEDEHDY